MSEKTKVGINIGKVGKSDRGITIYTQDMLREFDKQGPDNVEFVLLHYPGKSPEDSIELKNATMVELPYSDKAGAIEMIENEQVIGPQQQRQLGLDVVWHPHNRGQLWTPVPYVETLHDVLPVAAPELAGNYINSAEKRALNESRLYTARFATRVITDSQFSKDEIIKHLGVAPERIDVVHLGVNRDVYRPIIDEEQRAQVRDRYQLPEDYILTTGSYAPHKNQITILKAYAASRLPDQGIGLVMVGPNDATGYRIGYEHIKQTAEDMGLPPLLVRLLPSVPISDLVTLYSGAKLFTSASLYEGFGLTPLEAMACGIPVVASNATAAPEVLGTAALFSEPKDELTYARHYENIVGSNDTRRRLVVAGAAQVDKYDIRRTGKQTLDILIEAANSKK